VAEKPALYPGTVASGRDCQLRNAYRYIDRTVELSLIYCQALFRDAFDGLHNNLPRVEHWQLLCSRIRSNLSAAEADSFKNIYPSSQQVRDCNLDNMVELGALCLQLQARNIGPQYRPLDQQNLLYRLW
jgi:hypothetical protein